MIQSARETYCMNKHLLSRIQAGFHVWTLAEGGGGASIKTYLYQRFFRQFVSDDQTVSRPSLL